MSNAAARPTPTRTRRFPSILWVTGKGLAGQSVNGLDSSDDCRALVTHVARELASAEEKVVRGMNKRDQRRRGGFWLLALLWLPAGIVATAVVRTVGEPEPLSDHRMWAQLVLMAAPSLIFVAPCGLPLALASRWMWRLGYRRAAWTAGIGLGAVTAFASLFAGLLGPLGIAAYAAVLSVPVWLAAWWLSRIG